MWPTVAVFSPRLVQVESHSPLTSALGTVSEGTVSKLCVSKTERISVTTIALALALVLAVKCSPQELDPKDPVAIADGVSRADVVVIGTFRVHPSFPWFDGWHRRGTLQVQSVLFGNVKVGDSLQYLWLEPFIPASHACGRLSSWFDQTQGIWFLKRNGDGWKLSGTLAVWCGGPLPMDARDAVLDVVNKRR
jgi:hypothetical protein